MPDFMPFNKPGIGNVGSYQVSGKPWASSSLAVPGSGSSPVIVTFPQITKVVTVKNLTTGNMRVGFSQTGITTGHNFYVLGTGENKDFEIRVSKIFLLSDTSTPLSASVFAGLTSIETTDLVNNWSGSDGVG